MMTTPEIYIVEPSTSEEAKALKAFAKSLKMKITRQNTKSTDSTDDVETSLVQAISELNLIKEGKLKGISMKELLDEL